MKKLIKTNILTIIGFLVGALGGYVYWQQIGCASGVCAITASPVNSTIYAAIFGGSILSMFKKDI